MLPGKKGWLVFFVAVFIVCIIYAGKSVKPSETLPFQPSQQFSSFQGADEAITMFKYASVYGPEIVTTSLVSIDSNIESRIPVAKDITNDTTVLAQLAIPKVIIHTTDNSSFFFDKPTVFRYTVDVQNSGDKEIDRSNLRVTMKYLSKVASDVQLTGFPQMEDYNYGRNLIAKNDCKTCHQLMGKASILSFMQVSERYWDNKNAIGYLANKIISGGSGAWGQQVMSAHPQLSKEDATEIVKYVLSISVEKPDMEIPQEGTEVLNEHISEGNEGRYIFTATITDKAGSATSKDIIVLHSSKVEAERADSIHDMQKETRALDRINNGSYLVLKNIDLKDVHKLTYRYSLKTDKATIEVHTDSPDGQVISTATAGTTGSLDKYEEVTSAITNPGGKHDLFFVFVKANSPNENIASLDWIKFEGGSQVKVIEDRPPVKAKSTKLNVPGKSFPSKKQHNRLKQNPKGRKKVG